MAKLPETDAEEKKVQDAGGCRMQASECDETLSQYSEEDSEEYSEEYDMEGDREDEMEDGDSGMRCRRSGRLAAYIAGILTAFLCLIVFQIGWTAADRGLFGKKDDIQEEETGEQVLTDHATWYKLGEIQDLIAEKYLNEVDSDKLSSYLFKGVAAGLEDPYASYYSQAELQSVIDESRGEYFGIGATLMLDVKTGEHVVVEVYKDSPSEKAGLMQGDVLLSVEETLLDGVNLTDTVTMIKEQEGPFSVGVYRPETDETLTLTMECGEVELDYVEEELLEDQIGYVRVSEFTTLAAEQFSEALKALKQQGMEKLIVDLRGNPGGLLDSVLSMLDDILPKELVVYTENKNGKQEKYYTDEKSIISCEVAVLVDGYSASASEIFAGAVQDIGLGPVVGTQTYGKGVVQSTYFLSDGSAVKFTTDKYFTPKGQDIDGNGITPDVVIEEADIPKRQSAGKEQPEAEDLQNGTENSTMDETVVAEEELPDTRDLVLEKTMEVLRE